MSIETPSMDRRTLLRSSVMVAGSVVALPTMASLSGCSSAPPTLASHQLLITAIADRIIPSTDTGGAVAGGVPQYIAAVFEQHFTEDQQREFADALSVFDELAQDQGGSSFETASTKAQDEILTTLDTSIDGAEGKAIWQQLRDMTIFGYYTSEVATEELAYEEFPGRYVGCMPLSEIGAAWLDRGV